MSAVPWFLASFALCIAYAFWRGAGPERLTAAVFLAGVAASATLGLFDLPGGFASVPIQLATIDVLGAAMFASIAVRANRVWIIPFAACQTLTALAHVARALAPTIIPKGYAFLTVIWSWPMVLLLVGGTWAQWKRRNSGSMLPDWKVSSPRRA